MNLTLNNILKYNILITFHKTNIALSKLQWFAQDLGAYYYYFITFGCLSGSRVGPALVSYHDAVLFFFVEKYFLDSLNLTRTPIFSILPLSLCRKWVCKLQKLGGKNSSLSRMQTKGVSKLEKNSSLSRMRTEFAV
jgi:hypothetical protein